MCFEVWSILNALHTLFNSSVLVLAVLLHGEIADNSVYVWRYFLYAVVFAAGVHGAVNSLGEPRLRISSVNVTRIPYSLTPIDCIVLNETCIVFEYARLVTVSIQGGCGDLLRRAMFLGHELVNMVSLEELEVFDFMEGEGCPIPETTKLVVEMLTCARPP